MWFKDFLKELFSICRALIRLILVTIIFFIDGVHCVVFARREICDYDYLYTYQNVDQDKLAYIDRLQSQVDGEVDMEEGFIIDEDYGEDE